MRSRAIRKSNSFKDAAGDLMDDIRRVLENGRVILVASHVDPDGDAIGAQLAFASYLRAAGRDVFLVRETPTPGKYRFLPGIDAVADIDTYAADFRADTGLILECPNIERLGRAARLLAPDAVIVNVDHHVDNESFGNVNWIDPEASSVGEMAFEYFSHMGCVISRDMARQLYTAILTDTGRFRYSSTSARTMQIAGQLIEKGADPQEICDNVYFSLPRSTMKLTGLVLNTIEFSDDGAICAMTLTQRMLGESGADLSESEGLVDHTLYARGVLVGVLLREHGPRLTKVSLRSRGSVDVAALAARFNGGGHRNASGCTIPLPLNDAKSEVMRLIREVGVERTK